LYNDVLYGKLRGFDFTKRMHPKDMGLASENTSPNLNNRIS